MADGTRCACGRFLAVPEVGGQVADGVWRLEVGAPTCEVAALRARAEKAEAEAREAVEDRQRLAREVVPRALAAEARAEKAERERDELAASWASIAAGERKDVLAALAQRDALAEALRGVVTGLDGLVFHRAEDGTTTVTGQAVSDFEAWRQFVDTLCRARDLAEVRELQWLAERQLRKADFTAGELDRAGLAIEAATEAIAKAEGR